MWDEVTLRARIADGRLRTRFPGASPDGSEIAIYEQAVSSLASAGHALVLGMTPELRQMAGRRFDRLTSVDSNALAIDLYCDWVDPDLSESIVCEDWRSFLRRNPASFSVVLGDGIFGNVAGEAECTELVGLIARSLRPNGRFVTRMALVPDDFRPVDWRFAALLQQFRQGKIDNAEFGLTARLFGFFETAYDESTSVLDNRQVYAAVDVAAAAGDISAAELEVLRAFSYSGRNFLPGQREWESILESEGIAFRESSLHGKLWHDYYPVYECFGPMIAVTP